MDHLGEGLLRPTSRRSPTRRRSSPADTGSCTNLSMLGAKEAVRAIGASLLKAQSEVAGLERLGPGAFTEEFQMLTIPAGTRGKGRWKQFRPIKLPESGAYHGVVYSRFVEWQYIDPLADDLEAHDLQRRRARQFAILPRNEDEAADLYYRFLAARVNTPLHPLWAKTLWTAALAEGETVAPLRTVGDFSGYLCGYDPETLNERIRVLGRMGMLQVPWSGGLDDQIVAEMAAD